MQDRGLFINTHVRTGEVVEAGSELREYGLRACRWATERLIELPKDAHPLLVRQAIDPMSMSRAFRRQWQIAENAAVRLLVATRTLNYPREIVFDAVDDLIKEDALPIEPYSPRDESLGFATEIQAGLNWLGNKIMLERMGSLVWTAMIYEQSRMMDGMIKHGVHYQGSWT